MCARLFPASCGDTLRQERKAQRTCEQAHLDRPVHPICVPLLPSMAVWLLTVFPYNTPFLGGLSLQEEHECHTLLSKDHRACLMTRHLKRGRGITADDGMTQVWIIARKRLAMT